MKPNTLPLSSRKKEVDRIFSSIRAGDSCSIVGIGSVGKSNLLRFIQQDNVRQVHLQQEWSNFLFVYIDSNKLLQQSEWSLFELMLHQILVELSKKGIDAKAIEAIDAL